jgi:hypothetical protein
MSVHEIIAELPKLSEEERELILRRLVNLGEPFEQRRLWKTPYRKVSARYAQRKPIPRQKCERGSPHGLRGNLLRDTALADLQQITEFICEG